MSIVQFNLLPDIKLRYIKSQRTKKLAISVAVLVTGIAFTVMAIMLFTVNVIQKKQLSDADKSITKTTNDLKSMPNLGQALTVQCNLLPDIKLRYLKSQRTKKLAISVAVLVTGIAFTVMAIMLFTVNVIQKKQLSDADKSITKTTNDLKSVPNLEQAMTVQSQLQSLTTLHDQKHVSSRIFTYLPQVTPSRVNITGIGLDMVGNKMNIEGTADSQLSINTFIDTLKFTKFKTSDQDGEKPAFTSVVESSFSINGGTATYSLNLLFDPILFSNSIKQTPKLIVPQLTTLHVSTSGPLFSGQPEGEQ